MTAISSPINLFEYEQLAKTHLSQMAFDYYISGAGDEITLQENRTAFERIKLRPRMLVDVSQINLTTSVLGQPLQLPLLIAPMAFQCLAHAEGELATAMAAASAGVGMVLSTLSTKSLEEVAEVGSKFSDSLQWFQLYIHKDQGLTRALVERAYTAGYKALCLTVDAPVLGQRERDRRNEFALPPGLDLANLATISGLDIPYVPGESGLLTYFAQQLNSALTWEDLEWLQSLSPLPLVLKGILRGDDAARAVEYGAKAIVVSNHGGRQLDGAIASLDALPEIVAAVNGKAEVLLDGGIRRGTDIIKALAIGAQAVLIGRPILWGLAVGGQAGVSHVISLLQKELNVAMALMGCSQLQDIDSSFLHFK
ncbi:FMN-dependent alpha-hydroxy acid dehydrogenase [Trichormus variabilis ATCC 29413]|uniref:FMN-dependent alpha-hydroxy acid dehydrogenase n=2 Tax=Anabaena variabilis TaxID=264691 RepID=Q3MD83_TRIV2|nr:MULTISPECIES: alpha-hydroxy acid oxidase [Nostocaceae]ABA21053.1 FMN-dependent alpha-hydroxy acid dehydrogenase [Trichormus variabilis ATCC 29413]MBC1216663.1 alpha-hydroxy-acid oxidizing protein [Trichormus variabilis ARAD]MBC1256373.1 alpha-hydroxy-acid oxidizing protein [Trichormus variabilis V5]MBC1269722.1 alpha-hydroxy-acid oxidizing protein [Trichormus variabilis FSR]MBC1304706.1 alpha-hydroxy-acid oxidizing protein [Trichormus variabilis N2B]